MGNLLWHIISDKEIMFLVVFACLFARQLATLLKNVWMEYNEVLWSGLGW